MRLTIQLDKDTRGEGCLSSRNTKAGTQSRNLESGTETKAMEEYCFLVCFPRLAHSGPLS